MATQISIGSGAPGTHSEANKLNLWWLTEKMGIVPWIDSYETDTRMKNWWLNSPEGYEEHNFKGNCDREHACS